MKNKNNYNNSSLLSNREKEILRNRILESAQKEKKRKKMLLPILAAAASLAILFSLGFHLQFTSEPSIEDYVRSSDIDLKTAEGVTLILGNDSNINLDEKNSKIRYSESGEKVDIGSGKVVNQKSKINEKPAFNTILVPFGRRTRLQLSDGTIVWINSGSKLIFPAAFSGKSRSVYLEGEAIFDVAHNADKPFKVTSRSQEIEVLGTIFNVSSYAGDEVVETVLKSGSVNITYKKEGIKSIKLRPGTKASFNYSSAEVSTRKVNVDNYFSWKKGFLTLENTSLQEIMQKLARYYDVEIQIQEKDLAMESFSGNLDLKEDVEEVIDLIRQTSNFTIERNKDKIVILKSGTMKE